MTLQLKTASLSGNINESQPLNHLEDIINQCTSHEEDGYLEIRQGNVQWKLFVTQGKFSYISHSLDFAERIDVHLRRLSFSIPSLTNNLLAQVRIEAENEVFDSNTSLYGYKTICTLVEKQLLTTEQVSKLVFELSRDALFSCLCLTAGEYKFESKTFTKPIFGQLDPTMILPSSKRRLKLWQNLGPRVHSPYQRPYFSNLREPSSSMTTEEISKLSSVLRGFDFWHLSALLKEDELVIAQKLYPSIVDKTIILREPQAPFNQLPPIPASIKTSSTIPDAQAKSSHKGLGIIHERPTIQSKYTIACVDDSPVVLQTIERYLNNDELSILLIDNPMKALMEVIRAKPNLILLDVGMPKIDGYELCRLIRRNSHFRTTPIIMVTGNSGLINRAKAKMAGATDYMTKPFSQEQLSKMVFRYLTSI